MSSATFADGDVWPRVCAVTGEAAERLYSLQATTPLPDGQELSLAAASPGHLLSTSGGTAGWLPMAGTAARGQVMRRRIRAASALGWVVVPLGAVVVAVVTSAGLLSSLAAAVVLVVGLVALFVGLGRGLVRASDLGTQVALKGVHPSFVDSLRDHGLAIELD